jgi:hypothetical protein
MRRHLETRVGPERANDILLVMSRRFPTALVSGYPSLIPSMTNSPKDRHVLAAAIAGKASIIVTRNLKDFPSEALTPYGVSAIPPDPFAMRLLDDDPRSMLRAVQKLAESFGESLEVIHERLRHHVPAFVEHATSYEVEEAL